MKPVNQVALPDQFAAAVDAMCTKLIDKLPECTRYTKQQLNYWREMSWHQTIGTPATGSACTTSHPRSTRAARHSSKNDRSTMLVCG